jgi:hypothetical protein
MIGWLNKRHNVKSFTRCSIYRTVSFSSYLYRGTRRVLSHIQSTSRMDAETHQTAPTVKTVLGEKIVVPTGNTRNGPSGFWRGTDGRERYVKLYRDPEQAVSEFFSNQIYRDLGI